MTFQNGPSKSFVSALSSILPYACGLPFKPCLPASTYGFSQILT